MFSSARKTLAQAIDFPYDDLVKITASVRPWNNRPTLFINGATRGSLFLRTDGRSERTLELGGSAALESQGVLGCRRQAVPGRPVARACVAAGRLLRYLPRAPTDRGGHRCLPRCCRRVPSPHEPAALVARVPSRGGLHLQRHGARGGNAGSAAPRGGRPATRTPAQLRIPRIPTRDGDGGRAAAARAGIVRGRRSPRRRADRRWRVRGVPPVGISRPRSRLQRGFPRRISGVAASTLRHRAFAA